MIGYYFDFDFFCMRSVSITHYFNPNKNLSKKLLEKSIVLRLTGSSRGVRPVTYFSEPVFESTVLPTL